MTATILTGDCRDVLKTLPGNSVHCCVTSPPYWGLRDYGHGGQLGLESTPEEYVANMVAVFREVKRVLRPDGCVWLNLGDSYNGSGGAGGDYSAGGLKEGQPKYPGRSVSALKPKDLVGIPWRVAFALQADGWWLRSDVIWAKPNPMPESVTDRPTKAHEYIFLLTKSATYYYDNEAVKEQSIDEESINGRNPRNPYSLGRDDPNGFGRTRVGFAKIDAGKTYPTRNRRSVWTITTKPYAEAHFATYPPELPEVCILAGTSAHGCCESCGAPWERVVEKESNPAGIMGIGNGRHAYQDISLRVRDTEREQRIGQSNTLGFRPTCTCSAGVIPCTVLDPFAGSGTTGAVARNLGRDFIGIELNPEYVTLAERRIGHAQPAMFGIGA